MRSRLLLAVLLSALTCLAAVALMGTSAWLLSRAAQHPDPSSLTLAAVAVRALALSRALLRYGERLVSHDAVLRVVADLRSRVFDALRRTPGRDRAADDLSVLVSDVDAVQDLGLRALLPVASALVVAVASVTVVWWLLPAAGAVLLCGLGAGVLLLPLLSWWAASADRALAAWRAERQAAVVDLLHGCAELLVYGGTRSAADRARRADETVCALERRAAGRVALLGALGAVLQGGTTVVVALVAAAAVRRGELSPVLVGVVSLVSLASFEPVGAAADAAGTARGCLGSLRRVGAVLAGAGRDVTAVPSRDAVLVVDGLRHTFAGRDVPAVRAPALRAALVRGSSLAVVGGSGAGKSTLLRLLAGELVPDGGAVQVGAYPLSALPSEQRSRVVALATQDAHVFDATLGDNLRIGRPDASDAELRRALEVVGLDAWADGLVDGLGTRLGHRGTRLSGGQRKRLCVARAWLSPAPVLLLDEPTEGLQPDEADELVSSLLAASRDRAVVLVTHRVVALDEVEDVVVLERGRVAQHDRPGALRRTPGLFAEAWRLQAERPEPVERAG